MAPLVKRLSKELLSCWPNKKLSIMADHMITHRLRDVLVMSFSNPKEERLN